MAPITRSRSRALAAHASPAPSDSMLSPGPSGSSGHKRQAPDVPGLNPRKKARSGDQAPDPGTSTAVPSTVPRTLSGLSTPVVQRIGRLLIPTDLSRLSQVNRELFAKLEEVRHIELIRHELPGVQTVQDIRRLAGKLPEHPGTRAELLVQLAGATLGLPEHEEDEAFEVLRHAVESTPPNHAQAFLQGVERTARHADRYDQQAALHALLKVMPPENRGAPLLALGTRLPVLDPQEQDTALELLELSLGQLPPEARTPELAVLSRAVFIGMAGLVAMEESRLLRHHTALRADLDQGQPLGQVARRHGITQDHNLDQLSKWAVRGAAGRAVLRGESVRTVVARLELHDPDFHQIELAHVKKYGLLSPELRQALSQPDTKVRSLALQHGLESPDDACELSHWALRDDGAAGQAVRNGRAIGAVFQDFELIDNPHGAIRSTMELICMQSQALPALDRGDRVPEIVQRLDLSPMMSNCLENLDLLGLAGERVMRGESADQVIADRGLSHPECCLLLRQMQAEREAGHSRVFAASGHPDH